MIRFTGIASTLRSRLAPRYLQKNLSTTQNGPSKVVMTWGSSSDGQLGRSTNDFNFNYPGMVPLAGNPVKVSCGDLSTFAVIENGGDHRLFGWGRINDAPLRIPQEISSKFLKNRQVVDIASGQSHSLLLLDDKKVYSFGNGLDGQLGRKSRDPSIAPVEGIEERVKSVSCGWNHSLALGESGTLYVWGNSLYDQIGNGTFQHSASPVRVDNVDRPIVSMAGGVSHSVFLTNDDLIHVFGRDIMRGVQGHPGLKKLSMPEKKKPRKVISGLNHVLVFCQDGAIVSFGDNSEGQAGTDDVATKTSPRVILEGCENVGTGPEHCLATRGDHLLCWGLGQDYQCLPERSIFNRPRRYELFEKMKIHQLCGGSSHSTIIADATDEMMWKKLNNRGKY
ncbi:regulator of chromosome condensation-like protein [Planoprotostelium fungivorum]|uniref:Regulator of chromosome condensation-like protein n=1 Tax=Planoprotostelium fungivorum TaxID=1890364 RepID=A0A2P6N770_9EUKA|nr:regulator of chromosome condensation-like protein [Planoprotostelium fungivorum]